MRRLLLAASAIATLGLAACAVTPTPYQPAGLPGASASGGFSELQLEPNRFRVNFAGNSYTGRETVENYLLLRAAELTLSQGGDWFTTVERDTERRTRYQTTDFGPRYGYSPYFYPSWRYYGRFGGRIGWSPFYDPFYWDRSVDVREINRYEATAEIVIGRGPKPADPRAFDAREIVNRLGAVAVRPI